MSVKNNIIKVRFCFKFQKAVKPKRPVIANIKYAKTLFKTPRMN